MSTSSKIQEMNRIMRKAQVNSTYGYVTTKGGLGIVTRPSNLKVGDIVGGQEVVHITTTEFNTICITVNYRGELKFGSTADLYGGSLKAFSFPKHKRDTRWYESRSDYLNKCLSEFKLIDGVVSFKTVEGHHPKSNEGEFKVFCNKIQQRYILKKAEARRENPKIERP